MLLKRHYEGRDPAFTDEDLEAFQKALAVSTTRRVTHVDVVRHSKEWRPSQKVVARGLAEGWLKLDGDKLTIITAVSEPDVVYRISVPPGTYCCHCGDVVTSGKAAAEHMKKKHKGKKSPSNQHPAGYAVHGFFVCDLEVN